jgi:hypothetical protein
MSYVSPNFKTKKQLKEALTRGEHVEVYEPGLGSIPVNGRVFLEGPHSPQPHTWCATGKMVNGKLVEVK